ADGLLSLEPSDAADLKMQMWNPDGTPNRCGNVLRCVAALAHRLKHVQQTNFRVETIAGIREFELRPDGQIRTAMGQPQLAPALVPLRAGCSELREGTLQIGDQVFANVTALSTGSMHTVIFLDAPLQASEFQRLSPLIENAPLFPARTSVMWAVADGPQRFKIRIWERGAGETLACGTGACAVAVAAQLAGRARGPIEIESRGGTLKVEWSAPNGEIYLTGRATYVFAGQWNL
ncbi:MAG: diaminopimelate epimerase, partial [Gemmatimonadaceae bacterium]